jgi:hypothetical protein
MCQYLMMTQPHRCFRQTRLQCNVTLDLPVLVDERADVLLGEAEAEE